MVDDLITLKLSPEDMDRLNRPFVFKGTKKMLLDGVGFVSLVDWMGTDDSIVQAARVSHGDGTKTVNEDRKLIEYLVRQRHTSPFEHVVLKFHVKAPVFVFRQWHRHRTWSYNEVSARYTEMKDEFYLPPVSRMTTQDKKNRQGSSTKLIKSPESAVSVMDGHYQASYAAYQQLLTMGVARETAREVLPVSMYSEMYATVDLHNLMGFLALRMDVHAQQEIREFADVMYGFASQLYPWAMGAWDKTRAEWAAYEEGRLK